MAHAQSTTVLASHIASLSLSLSHLTLNSAAAAAPPPAAARRLPLLPSSAILLLYNVVTSASTQQLFLLLATCPTQTHALTHVTFSNAHDVIVVLVCWLHSKDSS